VLTDTRFIPIGNEKDVVEDGCVVCPLHGSKFDFVTDAALTLPAIEAEPVYNGKVDGVVYVAVADSGHDFTKECHPCP